MSFSSEVKEQISKNSNNIKKKCCRAAYKAGVCGKEHTSVCSSCDQYYIAGIFYSYGSISDPNKSANIYICAPRPLLEKVNEVLTNNNLPMRFSKRRGKDILYLRKNGDVEDFMTFIGEVNTSVKIMQINVIKTVKIDENRANNAEIANLDRASTASAEQLQAIKTLIADKRLYTLPEEYIYTANMRLENPDLSISELAELFDPPISKSGLSHRLKKLIEFSKSEKPVRKKRAVKKPMNS